MKGRHRQLAHLARMTCRIRAVNVTRPLRIVPDLPPMPASPIPAEPFDYVLQRVAEGASIRRACKELRAKRVRGSSPQRFLAWRDETPERTEQYARARCHGIELLADEMNDLVDNAGCDASGRETTDAALLNAQVNKARLRLSARQWSASKLLPKVYGDRVHLEHTGHVAIQVVTGLDIPPPEARDGLIRVSPVDQTRVAALTDTDDDLFVNPRPIAARRAASGKGDRDGGQQSPAVP